MLRKNTGIIISLLLVLITGCAISVDTTTLDFGSDKATETFTLTVQGPVEWSVNCTETWVTINPDKGQGEGTYSIDVTVERTGLTPGNYEAAINISTNADLPCPDVVVKMSVASPPPPPPDGISLISPVDGDVYYIGSTQTIKWVSGEDIKNEKVHIKIKSDNDSISITILDIETDNTGNFDIDSFGKDVLDDHTLWPTPLFKGRVIISVSYNDIDYSDLAVVDIPITLRILYNKMLAESGGLDSDLDRLPDSIEEFLGTDPYSWDSDGDGIHDYNELFGFGYFDDGAPIPDSNGDGIMDVNDSEYNDEDLSAWLYTDNDGDGIPNYLEYYGYTYDWMSDTYDLWDGKNIDQPYYKTDPLQPSTDQDPYGDAMETSGTLMDVSVREPGSMPMVPAYPNIVIRLEGYDVTLNQDITISEGESLAKDTNWSRSTTSESSHTSESFWEAGASVTQGFEYGTGGFKGKTEFTVHASGGGRTSNTNTRASTRSTGGSITAESNWQQATSTNPTDAARIKLFLKVYNHGTSAASNIIPTFTLKIGGMNIATFEQGNAQVNILEPGGVYPQQMGTYWVIDSIDTGAGVAPISLTLDELRALECGAPVSIVMTQMLADVMLMNSDGHWESAGDWGEHIARCDAVCSNMFLDIGDGSFIHYLLYSDDSPTSPRVTFRDALMWVAGGSRDEDDNIITYFDRLGEKQTISLQDWNFNFDIDTLTKNAFTLTEDGKLLPPSTDYNLANLVLGPDTVIVGQPPREHYPNENSPMVHYAYLDENMDAVRVCASDYSGIEKVTFQSNSASTPKEMEELVFNSGIYTLEIDSSYESNGSEKATVYSIDPDAIPAVVPVLKLEYPSEIAPIPPTIEQVYFNAFNHILSARVTWDPQFPVTSVTAYHYLIEPEGYKEMHPSILWWNEENGYEVKLENIDQDNWVGLSIMAEVDYNGQKIYDVYRLTESDVIKDGINGNLRATIDFRRNSCGEGWFESKYVASSCTAVGKLSTGWRTAILDLDTPYFGDWVPAEGENPERIAKWYNAPWNEAWNPQPPYDFLLYQMWDTTNLRFDGPWCDVSDKITFDACTRIYIEDNWDDAAVCDQKPGGIGGPALDPDAAFPKLYLTKTDQGRYAKVQISGSVFTKNTHYKFSCKHFFVEYDCDHCTWKERSLAVKYITFANEICDDGMDNDFDYYIDCDDPDCDTAPVCSEEYCIDGIDNNGDRLADCFDDECSWVPMCTLYEYLCDDEIDNDNDGKIDCADPDCALGCPEGGTDGGCGDDYDNDWDGYWDCEDPDCCSSAACAPPNGLEAPCCGDGLDNDGDGLTDCDDVFVWAPGEPEDNPDSCSFNPQCPEVLCDDGIDNDYDDKTDCDDEHCTGTTPCPGREYLCFDQHDNDGDGHEDCADSDCLNVFPCTTTEVNCTDQFDNDGDGKVDCDDENCRSIMEDGTSCCINDDSCRSSCRNGHDDDGDGLYDCADEHCSNFTINTGEDTIYQIAVECLCNDGNDNDNDGSKDCEDGDDADDDPDEYDCVATGTNPPCAPKWVFQQCDTECNCEDGYDNDQDTLTDCDDPDCDLDPACTS